MHKTILVTGKHGQLGQSLQKIAGNYRQYAFTFVGRDELDLAYEQGIANYFQDKHFDAIINCAAYTAVDKAESETELADQINHLAVKQIATIAKQQKSILIHISTDYVFDGTNYKPYVETDNTNPINVYGLSKLKGEQAIQAINPRGAIIRTSWVYSEFGNNFVKTMLRLGKECDSLNVIFDQVGSPTYATDLAQAALTVLSDTFSELNEQNALSTQNLKLKTYHYSNEGICSWYDFAQAIFDIAKLNCQVNPIETHKYPTPARRPHYSIINKAKIKQIPILEGTSNLVPYWRDALQKCLKDL